MKICSFEDNIQKVSSGLFFPFSLHSSWSNMIHVLQPFKITHSNTTSITQNIWQELNSLCQKNFFSLNCCWPIGSLNNQLAFKPVSILGIDRFLYGSWNEKITKIKKHLPFSVDTGFIFECLLSFITDYGASFLKMLLQVIRVNSVWIVDTTAELSDTYKFSTCLDKGL